MNTRRTAACLLLMTCIGAVSLSAGDASSTLVVGDLQPVASALNVSAEESGSFELAALLNAMVERLPAPSPAVFMGQGRVFSKGVDGALEFRTTPGALCRVYVIYEETDTCRALGETGNWLGADAQGSVSWTWHPDPETGGPVTALLRIRLDQAEYWRSFTLSVSD